MEICHTFNMGEKIIDACIFRDDYIVVTNYGVYTIVGGQLKRIELYHNEVEIPTMSRPDPFNMGQTK